MTRGTVPAARLVAFLGWALLARWGPADAKLVNYPLDERVADADLIVMGVLGDVRVHPQGGDEVLAKGRVAVDEVLWGSARRGDRLAVRRNQFAMHRGRKCSANPMPWAGNRRHFELAAPVWIGQQAKQPRRPL